MASQLAKIIADFQTQLSTELAIGGTSATIQSATDDDNVSLPAGRYFFTIDGDNSQKEHISCSLSGTSLTNIKSVSRQGVETTGAVRKHRVGATVTITDFKHIKAINDLLDGTTDLDASTPLKYDGVADMTGSTNKIATVKYVNDTAIAGAPDASTTVKGISKLSTAPASPTDPIAVGTNDTRMPTQGENDALAGSSGTPSSTNKYITEEDVSNAGASGKIVRATGTALPALDGSSLTNIVIAKNYIAGESISSNDAVVSGFYQSDGGIIYDNKATDISSISSSGGNRSFNYTVGSGTDRMLVVFFALGCSSGSLGSPTSVTYGGSSMTLARTESNSPSNVLYCYYLKNPSSGSNSLVITISASSGATQFISTCVVSYAQVDTISTVQGTNNSGGGYTTLNSAYTVGTTNMVIVSGAFVNNATGFTANALTNGQSTGTNSFAWCVSGDSDKAVESGTITTTNATNLICLGLLPKTSVSTTSIGLFKASSSNKVNGVNDDRYTRFIGIAKNSASIGQNVNVITNGVVSGLSGLSVNRTYFVNNTAGTIGTSAGTNSKKIGVSVSSTELLLKDTI